MAAGGAVLAAIVWHGHATDPDTGGYPQRIGFDRPSDRLPDRTDPLAGTLYDNNFGNGRNLGVTATGRLWQLPDGENLLSPSGARLLTRSWEGKNSVMLRDLSTGERRTVPGDVDISSTSEVSAFWSADETAVFTSFHIDGRPRHVRPAVLDLTTGALEPVGTGTPAGFLSPTRVVTLTVTPGRARASMESGGAIVATITDLDTGQATELPLRLAEPWSSSSSGLVASVAPDGESMILLDSPDQRLPHEVTVRRFSLTDGAELLPRTVDDWDGCTPTWRGNDPVIPTQAEVARNSVAARAELLTTDTTRSLVAVHPRLQSRCLQLTAAALDAGPRWALFGSWTTLLAFYPIPSLILALLLAMVVYRLIGAALEARSLSRAARRAPTGPSMEDHPTAAAEHATHHA
jgi:hypothetical protein